MIETAIKYYVAPTSTYIPEIETRLYIGTLPTTVTYPCAVMYSESRIDDMFESDVKTEIIKFICYAETLSSATDIAEQIKGRLKRYYGAISTAYQVINTTVNDIGFGYNSDIKKHLKTVNFTMRYI